MDYRLGTLQDLDDICELIKDAIAEMERHGIYQWDELYPTRDDFKEDIEKGTLFVVCEEDALAAFYVISAEYDEQYSNAAWEQDADTAYILHRFCVSPKVQNRGVGRTVLAHIEDQVKEMEDLYHMYRWQREGILAENSPYSDYAKQIALQIEELAEQLRED